MAMVVPIAPRRWQADPACTALPSTETAFLATINDDYVADVREDGTFGELQHHQ